MAAGIGALYDTDYFRSCCRKIKENRAWTSNELRALGFTLPESCTNFVFARHPGIDGGELYAKLRQRGVLVRHFTSERLKNYNRITIGSMEQMRTLIDRIKEILEENA